MARTMAREASFMLLYERELGSGQENTLRELIAPELGYRVNKEDAAYIDALVEGAWESRATLDEEIQENAQNWTLDRISRVELSLLRLAIYEMQSMPDVPVGVSVNEAVELAKKYAGEESTSFVHGILRAAAKKCQEETAQ